MARNTKDGVTGTGIVEENAEMLTGIYNMIVYEKQLIRNGGSRKGFLECERKLTEDEMNLLRKKREELYADYSNGVMILNNGIKFVQASSTSVEMQLNENKQTNSRLIYSILNLSEAVVTGTANDEQNSAAVKAAVLPIIKELETAVNRACLLESEKDRSYFALDVAELLKGDILKRYQAYQTGLNANFLQPDEVRYKEDLPPLGLDFIKLGLNDVLYNPKTKEVYTPNTNQTASVEGEFSEKGIDNSEKSGIIKSSLEERFNPYHDAKGRFSSGMSVKLLDGNTGRLANDGEVTKIVQIAGEGAKKPVKVAAGLSEKYHNKPSDWSKFRGDGYVTYPDGTTKHVEVHWFLSKQNNIVNFKVKREF